MLATIVAAVIVFAAFVIFAARRKPKPLPREQPSSALGAAAAPAGAKVEPIRRPAESALRAGLDKTKTGFIARLGALVAGKNIDDTLLVELEEILFTADIGARTAERLISRVRDRLAKKELTRGSAVLAALKDEARQILMRTEEQAGAFSLASVDRKPFVVFVIGVNGAGKTTTIGKLGAKWTALGKKVLFAAGDTFRAAAAEQLQIWATRAGADLVRGKEGVDPSSVVFDGVKRGVTDGFDIVLADTAGRLQTKSELMQELQKVRRVMQKALPDAPHETWLVLDATNGQNAIAQATLFKEAVAVTGIVLTKLDGTAKGGVVLGICEELGVPVRFVGVGEKVDDLRAFDADEFVSALFDEAIAAAQSAEAA
jgi:fused signal recognition particle receptor